MITTITKQPVPTSDNYSTIVKSNEEEIILRKRYVNKHKNQSDNNINDKQNHIDSFTLGNIIRYDMFKGIYDRLELNPNDINTLAQLQSLKDLYNSSVYKISNPIPKDFEFLMI